jgi:CRP-like cAMP-binding protein
MTENTELDAPIANRLLAALPVEEYSSLFSKMERVPLNYGEKIYEHGETIRHVYFPNSGIISMLAAIEDSSTLEVGILGKEGFAGLPVFLGAKASNNSAIVQGEGFAMKMPVADFLSECEKQEMLPRLIRRFIHSLLTQISQSAVCYRFHQIESRLARWLLMTSDRMDTNKFHLTQEFLSNMLGVRREAVNKSAIILQQQQLITYSRGNISIINRAELEIKTCLCYAVIKAEEDTFPEHSKIHNK